MLGHIDRNARDPAAVAPSVPTVTLGARRHATVGSCWPALMIDAQIAIDLCGAAPGEPVEIQAKTTPGHCRTKLAGSGHSFAGVFKANSSLAELCLWFRFRALYERALPESYAVRSAG